VEQWDLMDIKQIAVADQYVRNDVDKEFLQNDGECREGKSSSDKS
jgi:hypothetical protein